MTNTYYCYNYIVGEILFLIALKNLFQEKTKFAISIGGVAFAVLLIVLLNGLYQGWNNQMGSYVQNTPADFWVAQKGAGDMFHSVSFVSNDLKSDLKNIYGVSQVNELYGRAFAFKIGDMDKTLYIAGYNSKTGFGKPIEMKEGNWSDLKIGQIIIDESFARKNDLKTGDNLTIGDETLKISGISTGGNMLIYQYGFVTQEEARKLFNQKEAVNYYIVDVAKESDKEFVKNSIAQIEGVKVMTKAEFVENNQKIVKESFLPIIAVLDIIGFLIGIAVIGLSIYSATVDKSREYGVMKAIGVNNSQLLYITMWQSFFSGIIGYCIGIVISYFAAYLARIIVPDFITSIQTTDLLWAFCATIGMSIIASYIPYRRISTIDPAEVFKS